MQALYFIRKHARKIMFAIWGIPFFIFGSTKPDTPPVVVTEGIRLTRVTATANDECIVFAMERAQIEE